MKPLFIAILFIFVSFANAGTIYTIVGNGMNPMYGYIGPALDIEIAPYGVALAPTGDVLYISEMTNGRVQMVANGYVSMFAGNGNFGYSGDGGPATSAELWTPTGVAVSSTGDVYIADAGSNVVRVVASSGIITTFAGNGSMGYSGDGSFATTAQLNSPLSVAVTSTGQVYIVCLNVLRMVTPIGIITTVAGNGTAGYFGDGGLASNALLNNPSGVAVSSTGEVYIADRGNNRIRVISTDSIITTFAGNGVSGYSGDGGSAVNAQLSSPNRVSVSSNGDVYIVDQGNNVIRMVSSNNTISTIAGNGTAGFSGDGGPAVNATLNSPYDVAISLHGNVYISDSSNYRIRRVCNQGYTGYSCQFAICYGVNGTSANVCSGNGTCVAYNNCNCTSGFTGIDCDQKGSQEPSVAFKAFLSFWLLVLSIILIGH